MDTYKKLEKACGHFIKRYRDDLIKHDKNELAKYVGEFIHVTRESGTYLDMLIPGDEYPARGIYVNYMFGRANRERILEEMHTSLRHVRKNYKEGEYLIHHYKEGELKLITLDEGQAIITSYVDKIQKEWHKEDEQYRSLQWN